ncbi:MAG: hypothetical protein C5B50_29370 [Verrucomicrobia bacterium]|nr:MAG: hypothetical protein C5B50_29370 [Verrucomicrobiota bacterium]
MSQAIQRTAAGKREIDPSNLRRAFLYSADSTPQDGVTAATTALTRRQFVCTSMQAAAGLALASLATDKCFGSGKLLPPVALFTKVCQELKLDFEQSAQVAAESGLDGIDCPVRAGGEILPEEASEKVPRYAEALRRHGLRMLLLTTGIQDVSSPHARDILHAGKCLGIRYYRLGYWSHQPERSPKMLVTEIRSSLKELAGLNKDLGVCGVFQNHSAPRDHSRRNAGCDLAELFDIVKDFDPDQIGVAFDLAHALVEHGDGWHEHFERLQQHIRVVYVKDVQRPSRFVQLGEGDFGRTDLLQLLAKMNYRAPLSLHIEYDWAPKDSRSKETLVKTIKENRRVLGQWLAKVN